MPNEQGRYWLLTIPFQSFVPWLPPTVCYIKGQLERGESTSYLHWQVFCCFEKRVRLRAVKRVFGEGLHAEYARSSAASEYVWKDATSISETRFELGELPRQRSRVRDWERIWESAKAGEVDAIEPDIRVRYYSSIKRIQQDYLRPIGFEKTVSVFWGSTGVGKSRLAWEQAGLDAYPKDPLSKFWDGYRGQKNVVVDEFRGVVNISHLLRWLDRYPVIVEVKGSSTVLCAEKIWITSNIHPREWYPDLDQATMEALLRRLTIIHFDIPFR